MIKFDAYSGKDLQQFMSMLNQCETNGVTEIRFVRQKIHEFITSGAIAQRITFRKEKKLSREKCPECGNGYLNPIQNEEKLNIVGCSKCRYSKILEDK